MKYLYIANWKMNLSYHESIAFCTNNKTNLKKLSEEADIVLCPSFLALAPIADTLKNSNIFIGAQNCSEYTSGSYTGEISAQSLAEIGVAYCFVGHSERRIYFGETTDSIIKKINLLLDSNIQPIICIGEKKQDFENAAVVTVLNEQLKPILDNMIPTHKPILIAYEPVWSIGTGIIPENSYLEEVFSWIAKLVTSHKQRYTLQLLYGGSVTEKNIAQLKKVPNIDGFLVGNASTDFKQLYHIIKSLSEN